jgi:P pilus assembly chaperone PapD
MGRLRDTRLVLVLLAVAAITAPGGAATTVTLRINPTSLTLDAAHPRAQITMTSFDARTVIFDADAVSWQQSGDQDRYAPAADLIVVPPVYDIGPFRTMLVRVGLRTQGPAPATEAAFAVRFREVLASGTATAPRTLVAPVFVAPAKRYDAVRYALERTGPNAARLDVRNAGNIHVYLGDVRIRSGESDAYAGSLDSYVLAGNARAFPLMLRHPLDAANADLTIGTGGPEQTVHVPVR